MYKFNFCIYKEFLFGIYNTNFESKVSKIFELYLIWKNYFKYITKIQSRNTIIFFKVQVK